MKTSYQPGDRARIGTGLGMVTEVLPLKGAYRVRMDDGRTLTVAKELMLAAPPEAVSDMQYEIAAEPAIPRVRDKALKGPRGK